MRDRYTCGNALLGIARAACSNFIAAVALSFAEYARMPSSSIEFDDFGLNINAAATPAIRTTAIRIGIQIGRRRRTTTAGSATTAAGAAAATLGAGAEYGAAGPEEDIRPASSFRKAV